MSQHLNPLQANNTADLVIVQCPQCHGAGHFGPKPVPADNPFCSICDGKGTVRLHPDETATCAQCVGVGSNEGFEASCPKCSGTGRIANTAPATFHVRTIEEKANDDADKAAEFQRGLVEGQVKAAPSDI